MSENNINGKLNFSGINSFSELESLVNKLQVGNINGQKCILVNGVAISKSDLDNLMSEVFNCEMNRIQMNTRIDRFDRNAAINEIKGGEKFKAVDKKVKDLKALLENQAFVSSSSMAKSAQKTNSVSGKWISGFKMTAQENQPKRSSGVKIGGGKRESEFESKKSMSEFSKKMEQHPCFKNVGREELNNALQYKMKGTCLIRPSETQPGNFTLSVSNGKDTPSILKYMIKVTPKGYQVDNIGTTFESIDDVIGHFGAIKPGELEQAKKRAIAHYAKKLEGSPFFKNISGAEASSILQNNKHGSALIRRSGSDPGSYVLSFNSNGIGNLKIRVSENGYQLDYGNNKLSQDYDSLDAIMKNFSIAEDMKVPEKSKGTRAMDEYNKLVEQYPTLFAGGPTEVKRGEILKKICELRDSGRKLDQNNFYEILGLKSNCTDQELTIEFRLLKRALHVDKFPEELRNDRFILDLTQEIFSVVDEERGKRTARQYGSD